MIDVIGDKLLEIQKKENVHIFYACESGSRAWGFPSANSDYDVRFVYVRPKEWYLSIDVDIKRDVIEIPISDELDISGWDLRKALGLLRKSNPPLLEWFSSPIIYLRDAEITDKFLSLMPLCYSPTACIYHYLNMARNNFREYLKGEVVSVKKYFYVMRPILAIKWIETKGSIIPMEFGELVNELITDQELRREIDSLIVRKRSGDELKREPRIEPISLFIENELKRLESTVIKKQDDKPQTELLNVLFREILEMPQIARLN
ncbi:MAG: nucleotidyltransferase domain-containing protein [Acidobacteria bacterium]|nr:nucleotidyltransferase domain-containing protein [Acidobacteriota bacterium]